MKNIKKLLILLLVTVLFVSEVSAAVDPNTAGCFTVTEEGVTTWDAGFQAKLPVCITKKRDSNEADKPDGYSPIDHHDVDEGKPTDACTAYNFGTKTKEIHYWVERIDAKAYEERNVTVPLCTSPKRTIKVSSDCTIAVKPVDQQSKVITNYGQSAVVCSDANDNYGLCMGYYQSGLCEWKSEGNNKGKCVGDGQKYIAPTYGCASGYHEVYGGKCCADGWEKQSDKCCPEGARYTSERGHLACYLDFSEDDLKYQYDYYDKDDKAARNYCGEASRKYAQKKLIETAKKEIKKGEVEENYSFCADISYKLMCPYYVCQPKYPVFNVCTPSFSVNGAEAYCINPNAGFDGNYKYSSFDVTTCQDSFSNADCGYANILIESAFHNINDKAQSLALRLWAYHSGQNGFEDDKPGVANVVSEGGTCNYVTHFYRRSPYMRNIYKTTYEYMITAELESIARAAAKNNDEYFPDYVKPGKTSRQTFDGRSFPGNIHGIVCNSTIDSHDDVAVACGNEGNIKTAIELFYNTLIGNKYMKEHLAQLYPADGDEGKTGIVPKPTGANIEEGEEDDNEWIVVSFSREDMEKVMGDEEVIVCDGTEPAKVTPYCKMDVVAFYYDGTPVPKEKENVVCYKEGICKWKLAETAICRPNNEGYTITTIEVKYQRDFQSYSVRKLIPCGNTVDNQFMFVYYTQDQSGMPEYRWDTKVYPVTGYDCGGCSDYGLRGDVDDGGRIVNPVCSLKNETNENYYNRYIKDPSLGCIVTMESKSEKDKYDYSELFGVNTNFCRVFCSDEVEYYLADVTETISGRPYIYNIIDSEKKFFGNKINTDIKLSAAVRQKRSCVSEISYGKPTYARAEDLMVTYGIDPSEAYNVNGKTVKFTDMNLTWNNIFEFLKAKNTYNRGGTTVTRNEVLTKLIYDLYNCNLYDSIPVEKPTDASSKNTRQLIREVFAEGNNYNLNYNNGKYNNTDVISYNFGPQISEYNEYNDARQSSETEISGARVGYGANSVPLTLVKNSSGKTIVSTGASERNYEVKYCTDTNERKCFTYVDLATENYDYQSVLGPSRVSSAKRAGIAVIPENDYAYFEVTAEVNYFNNKTYHSINNTGNIATKGSDQLLQLDKYSYPTDKYAYNSPIDDTLSNDKRCIKKQIEGDLYDVLCPVTQSLTVVPFNRKDNNDKFVHAVVDKKGFICYIEIIPGPTSSTKGAIYRNVEPDNLFPFTDKESDKWYEKLDETNNWRSEEGIKAKEQIESTADRLKVTDDLLEYSITLNPSQIKELKKYNKAQGAYVNENTHNCTADKEKGIFINCTRDFLNLLRSSDVDSTKYATLDPNYRDGISKYTSNPDSVQP